MTPPLDPEERVRRVKAALAEAGWPDTKVSWSESDDSPSVLLSGEFGVPDPVFWRGMAICDEMLCCWPCWQSWNPEDCTHDPLTSPWPEVIRNA